MTRHSHEDALTDGQFEHLVDATTQLDDPVGSEALIAIYLAGRLGMRSGEIIHMRESWINWDRAMIEIPTFEPCTKGQDGGICGYCRQQAEQTLDYDPSINVQEEMKRRWKPKTDAAARAIPFDFDPEIEAVVESWFSEHDDFPVSRVSLNRRIDAAAEAAGIGAENLYPHALRATAATYHAYRGLEVTPLKALMGWERLAVAEKYIRLSGGATARALKDVHS